MRKLNVLSVGEWDIRSKHMVPAPSKKLPVHLSNQYQRCALQVPDLEKLPDHCCLQQCADAAGHDDECIRHQYKLMKASEKRSVLISLGDERVHILLEGKLHADPDRSFGGVRVRPLRAFIGRLHQPRTATRDNVTSQSG